MTVTLVIGSKRWSSWSLRPWMLLMEAGIRFDEIVIPLRRSDTKSRLLDYSPAGKAPILIDGDRRVWDSLAIMDYIADRFPESQPWPQSLVPRALARSIAAEMHSGFAALRRELPMDVTASLPTPDLSADARADVDRIQAIWRDARTRFGGDQPFLFGRFGAADAMYAPVATRFQTYAIPVDPICRAYMDAVLNLPSIRAWRCAAADEAEERNL